jgi:uncharacterized SAM-binding protein YcdF (DUF218 family)
MSTAAPAPSRPSAASQVVASVPRTGRGIITALAMLLAFALLLIPIGVVLQIVLTAQFDDRTKTQAIVVLDPAKVWGNPAPVLRARLDHAADLYAEGVAPVIIVAGPQRYSEQAKAHLLGKGVAEQDIVVFTTGRDTVGSLQVIASVMKDLDWSSATVVTDPANAARADATATQFGIDAHMSPTKAGPGTALTSEYVGRETAALMRYYLLTRWGQPRIILGT